MKKLAAFLFLISGLVSAQLINLQSPKGAGGLCNVILSGPVEALIIESMTNAQKLGLSPTTAVGTKVKVTDGFVVSGFGDARDGFYFWNEGSLSYVKSLPYIGDGSDIVAFVSPAGLHECTIGNNSLGTVSDGGQNSAHPWDSDWSGATPPLTLTHPAVQQLAAPSTAQGGVFVLNGPVEGISSITDTVNGRPFYALMGASHVPNRGVVPSAIGWSTDNSRWEIMDGTATLHSYSLSDVASPDLAIDWKLASDDSPAGITVTSVTQGEIVAGLFVANDGATNGSSYVSQPFHGRQYYMGLNGGGSNNMHWDTDYFLWTDDVGVWSDSNVAFPWQGVDSHVNHSGATFSRNNVAAEQNWQVVP